MTRPLLPRLPATRPTSRLAKGWQLSLLSAAIALALGITSTDASALALGRLNVQSALGEPLRAEIDVTEITAAEAENMKVHIASSEAFRAAGVAYSAALADVRVSLQRRANGRYVVRLAGSRSLNDPFVDLLVEANWNSGRIVRDYTVLLDPPGSRQATALLAPQTSMAAPVQPRDPQAQSPAPVVVQAAAPRRQRPAPVPVTVAKAPARTGSGEQQVTVQHGDTASKIAGAYKPADVSLDQMLVALLRSNPNAFIGGNINRMKAGAVVDVPTAAQASAVPASDAKRTVTAQSHDFGEFRRRLADSAPTTRVASAGRQASGKLEANVEDRNAAAKSPDKLTISQGTSAARAAEDKLASERQAQDGKTRVAELSKNIDDLNKLKAATAAAPAAATSTPPSTAPAARPGASATPPAAIAPPAAAAPAAITSPAAANASTTATAAAPSAAPGTPAATSGIAVPPIVAGADASSAAPTPAAAETAPKPPVKATPTPPPEQPGFVAELLDNPLLLGGAAIIALLIGFLLYRVRGRKRQDAGHSVFLESRMPKDSFFGASGGESVDTKHRGNSVLSYSPSQLDAGDVDPVAEADVYLAYGRDLQAEEILREALRVNPQRTAIHLKLLEIHAKRRDLRAYESLATEVRKLTGGSGNEWNRVVEMGKNLDPGNPLYESSVRSASAVETKSPTTDNGVTIPMPKAPIMMPVAAAPPAFLPSIAPLDFDLDLSKPAAAKAAAFSATLPPATSRGAVPFVQTMREAPHVLPSVVAAVTPLLSRDEIDLENDFDTAPAALEPITRVAGLDDESTHPATLRAGPPEDSGFIEFDMSSLGGLPRTPTDTVRGRLEPLDESTESPHAVKLSLARELQALGDVEGARSLVEEVEAESSGDAKSQARQLLAQLN
jgi:pilus assembly protein FimV